MALRLWPKRRVLVSRLTGIRLSKPVFWIILILLPNGVGSRLRILPSAPGLTLSKSIASMLLAPILICGLKSAPSVNGWAAPAATSPVFKFLFLPTGGGFKDGGILNNTRHAP